MIRAVTEKAIAKAGCKLTDFNLDAKSKTETMVCGSGTRDVAWPFGRAVMGPMMAISKT